MDILPSIFTKLLDSTTLAVKQGMLNALTERIKLDSTKPTAENLESFVDYFPNIIPSEGVLADVLLSEVNSMLSKSSTKVCSQWVSMDMQPYTFGSKTYNAVDMRQYSGLCQLLDIVNKLPSSTGDMNCCLVNKYSDHNVAGRLHKDDEDIISDKSSIVTVSLGAERVIDFAENSKSFIIKTLTLQPNSAFVMRPGCQELLKHRLNKGKSGSGVRFSISFRRSVIPNNHPPAVRAVISSDCSQLDGERRMNELHDTREPLVVIAGDSLAKYLKPDMLGKGRVAVKNIAVGGHSIHKTEQDIIQFHASLDPKYRVDKVFLSVGCNDLRHVYSRGIRHLKAPLTRLIGTVRELFPGSVIYFQSLLPFHVENPWTVKNVLGFNALLKECCFA